MSRSCLDHDLPCGTMRGQLTQYQCPDRETVYVSVQGEMKANFLRHEGFLGAVGAFLKVHPMAPTSAAAAQGGREPRKVRSDSAHALFVAHC